MAKLLLLWLGLLTACGAPFTAQPDELQAGSGGSPAELTRPLPIVAGDSSIAAGGAQPVVTAAGGAFISNAGSTSNSAGAVGQGTAGAPETSMGGQGTAGAPAVATCLVAAAVACEGRSCGYVPDGCGGQWACGTPVCALASDGRTPQSCVVDVQGHASCQVTCADAGASCGDIPAFGLHCGGCTEQANGACGVELPGLCSYCQDAGPVNGGLCPTDGQHVWSICGSAPSSNCTAIPNRANQWCCDP